MSDLEVEPLLAVFDRHTRGKTVGRVSASDREAYTSVCRLVRSVVKPETAFKLGAQPCRAYNSATFPNAHVPQSCWAGLLPSGVTDKHYAMWVFVDLSRDGVEIACYMGWGDTKTDKNPEYVPLINFLNATRQRLRETPESCRSQLRAQLADHWTFKSWQRGSHRAGGGEDLRTLDGWLDHAGTPGAVGATISRQFPRGTPLSMDELAAEFGRAVQLFGPLFDVAYPEPIPVLPRILPQTKRPSQPAAAVSRRIWVIAAGRNGEWWGDWQANGIATIGWTNLGDLRAYPDQNAVFAALQAEVGSSGDDGDVRPSMRALACWQFAHVVRRGDVLVAKDGKRTILGAGEVVSDYVFDDTRPAHKQTRKVRWLRSDRTELPAGCKSFARKTLTHVTSKPEFAELLAAYADGTTFPAAVSSSTPKPFTADDAMTGLFMSREQFDSLLSRLRRKQNLILQGPPGVGKTFVARRLAYALLGAADDVRVTTVQFHQSYAYEDFVQGWRPNGAGGFELRTGLFHDVCTAARADPGRPHVLVIDEINRGNVSRIFGELLMLIEAGYRGERHAIPLTYSKDRHDTFFVPENLYILGLMNTADRSLAIVDYALRRRFAFATVEPGFASEAFGQHLAAANAVDGLHDRIRTRLAAVNRAIADDKDLGPGFVIGHSYFCCPDGSAADEAWYRDVIEAEVAPLLREYWFDQPKVAQGHIEKLLS